MSKTLKYDIFNANERQYWNNLHVNVGMYCDKWEIYSDDLQKVLNTLEVKNLKDIAGHYSVSYRTGKIVEDILTNKKASIDFYCLVNFVKINPKAISLYFNIPIVKGNINRPEIIMAAFHVHKNLELFAVFLKLRKQKVGRGNYYFSFNQDSSSNLKYEKFYDAMHLLASWLKRQDKQNKRYHFRDGFAYKNEWFFLILKETNDVVLPAIEDNKRVIRGDYILITYLPKDNKLEINNKSKKEAYYIRQYLSRSFENELKYTKIIYTYNPITFFNKVLEISSNKEELSLTEASFRRSNLNTELQIADASHKNSILVQLTTLKDKDLLKLNDFSEFKSLTFYFKGISFRIFIEENKWGQYRLNLFDKSKPSLELNDFIEQFEQKYEIKLNTYLNNQNQGLNTQLIARKIFNNKTIESNIPFEVEKILLDFIDIKLLNKPTKLAKRRCESCKKITWIQGDCPECGNPLFIEGSYIDINLNEKHILDFIYKQIKDISSFRTSKTKKQINKNTYNIYDIIDKEENTLSVFVTFSNIPKSIVEHYEQAGNPLLIILVKYKDALFNDTIGKGFECIDLAELYALKDKPDEICCIYEKALNNQKQRWEEKIVEIGYSSYQRLINKPKSYTDQNFEIDIYNILHELFHVGDRLGGNFTGITAPDGIVMISNRATPSQRYCFAWDCKYSTFPKGYQLTDIPKKHRKYINILNKNDKVLFYGGLKTYAIISQNMDFNKYKSFYAKLVFRFRWKGNVIFIPEKVVLDIYKFYKENSIIFLNNPGGFYKPLFRLLKNIWKKDSKNFPEITMKRIDEFYKEVQNNYNGSTIKFKFKRNEFN